MIKTMTIRRLVIEKNGKVRFARVFRDTLTVLRPKHKSLVTEAVRLVMGGTPCFKENETSWRIFAEVEIDDRYLVCIRYDEQRYRFKVFKHREERDYTAWYLRMVCATDEERDVCFFDRRECRRFPIRLSEYKQIGDRVDNGRLHEATGRYGDTRSFRGYIASFVRHFRPYHLCEKKPYRLTLSSNGEFEVQHDGTRVDLSACEQTLFRFHCCVRLADFWRGFESRRNLNYVRKPLICAGLAEHLDESVDLFALLKSALDVYGQVIVFADLT